ncbi:MAG: DUF58 domain-containing protein [Planctomycetota bacterium]|nr:DUF58 domain-containing protein [Planctomycetota bacterium]MDA1140020.1 DUF58 domain-containing protein [Planctomycetota bacterium]
MPGVNKGQIDPRVLTTVKDLELKARVLVEGLYIGLHDSPLYGYSPEFADHRQYYQGDDLRGLDWKVYARTDRYVIKRYKMESDMRVMILLDSSASMGYGSGDNITKLDYGIHLAAALSHLIIHQNDRSGLVLFDDEIRTFMPARGGVPHLRQMLHHLQTTEPGARTSIVDICHQAASRLSGRGLVVLISDFLDPNYEQLSDCFSHFRFARYDVIVMHLLDPAEIDFSFQQIQNFRDLETGEELVVEPETFRSTYTERVQKFRDSVESQCLKAHIDYEFVRTSQPLERVLFQYLSKRAKHSLR